MRSILLIPAISVSAPGRCCAESARRSSIRLPRRLKLTNWGSEKAIRVHCVTVTTVEHRCVAGTVLGCIRAAARRRREPALAHVESVYRSCRPESQAGVLPGGPHSEILPVGHQGTAESLRHRQPRHSNRPFRMGTLFEISLCSNGIQRTAASDSLDRVDNLGMDTNQNKVIELLREVHLLAFKEIERLNLRIAELETADRKSVQKTPAVQPASTTRPSAPPGQNGLGAAVLNERQVAEYLSVSVACLRRWRLFRKGPRFLKIGRMVRYRREDVQSWLNRLDGTLFRNSPSDTSD